jgi:hypothetical protein
MKKVIASLVAVAGMSVAASGQGIVDWQVSTDGINWSNSADVLPGSSVVVRAFVSAQGAAANIGLASFVMQPVVSSWTAADTARAFINSGVQGNAIAGSMILPGTGDSVDGPFGRFNPWGRTATSGLNAIKAHVHTGGSGGAPAGTWLRIAQGTITSWLGGTGNTTGNSGVPISQNNQVTQGATYETGQSGLVVFQFGITLSGDDAGRQLSITVPELGFGNRNTTTGVREMYWFATGSETTGSIRGAATSDTAFINVVPTPASIALLGLGGLIVGRRRR